MVERIAAMLRNRTVNMQSRYDIYLKWHYIVRTQKAFEVFMKKIFLPLVLLSSILSACGTSNYCQASPFCSNPGGNVGIVSFADALRVSIRQGDTVSVPVKLSFNQVSVSESLVIDKADAAAKSSSDPTLVAVIAGDIEVRAASDPFTVNSSLATNLSFKASPTAKLGQLPGQNVRIIRVKIQNAQVVGTGLIIITVLPK